MEFSVTSFRQTSVLRALQKNRNGNTTAEEGDSETRGVHS